MTTERIKEILAEYEVVNKCILASNKEKERCNWEKCIHCNTYEDEKNAMKQAVNESIEEFKNKISEENPYWNGDEFLPINNSKIKQIAERLKVK